MQIHRTSCGKKNTNKHNWGGATLSEKLHYPIGLVCWGKNVTPCLEKIQSYWFPADFPTNSGSISYRTTLWVKSWMV